MKARSDGDFATALARLRQHLADVEREIALVENGAKQELASALVWEERAMSAIRRGDDRIARDALLYERELMEAAAAPEADLKVLKALADECRLAIAEAERRQSPIVGAEPT